MSDLSSRPARRGGKIGELIAREILAEITERGLAPGSPLPSEAQMLETYKVGRGTLREALRILEVNGLISIKPGPGGGPFVEEASAKDLARISTLFFHARRLTMGEVVEARLVMEPVCARLAAQRRTGADVEVLERMVFDPGADESEYRATSAEFHAAVIQMGANGVVGLFSQALSEIFHARVHGLMFPAGVLRRTVVRNHAAVARAIIDGDAESAERRMREHMEDYLKYVRKNHPTLFDEQVSWLS
ncbi:FadR/GntR family transcriptional regulator [Streptomyces sp. WG-D5]